MRKKLSNRKKSRNNKNKCTGEATGLSMDLHMKSTCDAAGLPPAVSPAKAEIDRADPHREGFS